MALPCSQVVVLPALFTLALKVVSTVSPYIILCLLILEKFRDPEVSAIPSLLLSGRPYVILLAS